MLKLLLRKTRIILQENSAVKGEYALRRSPYHDRIRSTPVEPMHVVKDVAEHIVRLLAGVTDTKKVQTEEKARKQFRNSWLASPENTALSPAPFSFSKEELCIANSRAKSISVPSSFDWRPSDLFTSRGMKSHEWKEVVCSGVIKYCIRGLLGENQRATLYKICDLMSRLFCHQFTSFEESVEADTHIILSLIERDFPVSLNSMVLHLLHHLPYYLKMYGPVYGFWMYPFERFNCWISQRVTNRHYPESTVLETYRYYEWASFLQMSGHVPEQSITILHVPDYTCNFTEELDVLSNDQFRSLKEFYLAQFPEYN